MNVYRRGLILATFMGCCASLVLLSASLSTDHWVQSNVHRMTSPFESSGRVHFGLFSGKRELNVGYGWRIYAISVGELMNAEPDFLHFGLWITSVSAISGAIVSTLIGAFMSIVNTAITPVQPMAARAGLFVFNIASLLLVTTGAVAWIVHFYLRMARNILVQEDRDNHWSSEGHAHLGYSFWFVIGSAFCHAINIVLLVLVSADERKKLAKSLPTEKYNGTVLLY